MVDKNCVFYYLSGRNASQLIMRVSVENMVHIREFNNEDTFL